MKTITPEQALNSAGQKLETTDWFTITQKQIDQFADCTHDHQFIHTDPEKAQQTTFGGTIAHGFLSMSMLSYFAESFSLVIDGRKMSINYGFNKVRFISPVKVDSRIRCHARVAEVMEKTPGQFMITTDVEIEIEGDKKPALIAQWVSMQFVNRP